MEKHGTSCNILLDFALFSYFPETSVFPIEIVNCLEPKIGKNYAENLCNIYFQKTRCGKFKAQAVTGSPKLLLKTVSSSNPISNFSETHTECLEHSLLSSFEMTPKNRPNSNVIQKIRLFLHKIFKTNISVSHFWNFSVCVIKF